MSSRRVTQIKAVETWLLVEGRNPFPLDMLRYDSCIPARELDAAAIRHSIEDGPGVELPTSEPGSHGYADQDGLPAGARRVLLRRLSGGAPVTYARWQSFGWRVLNEWRERPDGFGG